MSENAIQGPENAGPSQPSVPAPVKPPSAPRCDAQDGGSKPPSAPRCYRCKLCGGVIEGKPRYGSRVHERHNGIGVLVRRDLNAFDSLYRSSMAPYEESSPSASRAIRERNAA